jgi:hypothetical protein
MHDVIALLKADGVDTDQIFYDADKGESDQLARLTRSDMVEIAAAASMLAQEQVAPTNLVMPNVPKGSRGQSVAGIDILAVVLDPNGNPEHLESHEKLYIGSVKHTTGDMGDLRRKLVSSVSEQELSFPYLAGQLRVLEGRLAERGISARRVFLLLRVSPLLHPAHIRIVAVGAVDLSLKSKLARHSAQLGSSEPELRRLRWLLIEDIANLHKAVTA